MGHHVLHDLITRRLTELGSNGRRLTIREAAARCGMPVSSFHFLSRASTEGRRLANPAALPRVANGLGIPLPELRQAAARDAGYGE